MATIKNPELLSHLIVESAPNSMIVVNNEGEIAFINSQTEKLFGYQRNELLGQSIEILIPQRYKEKYPNSRTMFFGPPTGPVWGAGKDLSALRKDGTEFPVEIGLNLMVTSEGTLTLAILVDITDRKYEEISLATSEKRFRTFFENAAEAIIILDIASFTFIRSNANALHLFRLSSDALHQLGPDDISPEFQPDGIRSSDKVRQLIAKSLNGEKMVFEWLIRNAEGKDILCEVRLVALPNVNEQQLLASFVDIAERKKEEQEAREAHSKDLEERVSERTIELTEANKALEGFSYSVSHDLQAPVRTIVGFSAIIQKEHIASLTPEVRELFGYVESNAKRMGIIIEDLLTLARYGKEKLKIVPINMTDLFKSVWTNIMRHSPNHAILKLTTLPSVEADMSMIEQVLVNLISNAIKYSAKKEHPVVEVGFQQDNDFTSFFVKDNGAGFDMQYCKRLFGAFQRLHTMSEFEGTGVGLLLVKRIIEKHGGTVWAEGKVGEGATFWFSLPRH